jgi:hypothetical protein
MDHQASTRTAATARHGPSAVSGLPDRTADANGWTDLDDLGRPNEWDDGNDRRA